MEHLAASRGTLGEQVGGRYRLLRLISSSPAQDVFEADDELLSRRVAVKLHHGDAAPQIPLDNPDLARVLDGGEHRGVRFIVMELADDPTLIVGRPADHTSVMPVALTPVPEPEPDLPVAPPLGRHRPHRALVAVLIGGLVLVLLAVLVAADDGDLDIPPTTVPATAPTTTVAPTTTSAPAPQPAPKEDPKGKGHGKGSRGND